MEKNIIGKWGTDLDEAEYARALAALGVLESSGTQKNKPSDDPQELLRALVREFEAGERTVVWREAFTAKGTNLSSWQETSHQNPAALAEAWLLLMNQVANQPRNRPRLAVEAAWRDRADLFDLESLLGWLAKPEAGCQALNLVPEDMAEEDCRYLWHWPVRVGIPTGPLGEVLMQILQVTYSDWVKELAQLQWIGEARDSCDLLILPPGMAAQLAEAPRLRLRPSFIVCLDNPAKSSQVTEMPADRLMKRTGAAGIAVVGEFPQGSVPGWFREIIRNLSHDMPVHAAIWEVGRYVSAIPPAILGLPHLLDRLRILAIAERADRKRDVLLGAAGLPPMDFGIGAESEADYVRESPFTSEQGYGIPAATRFSYVENNLDSASPPRWIQADVRHEQTGAKPAKALAPGQPSLLSVYIGPSAVKRTDAAFPDQNIDYRDGPVQVNLQIELAGAAAVALSAQDRYARYTQNQAPPSQFFLALAQTLSEPEPADQGHPLVSVASQSISLPATGNSEQAEFAVWPQPGVSEVRGRIAVIHQNRIIQTARLTAPVGKENDVLTAVVVEAEQIVYPRLDNLDDRRDADAAFIVADDLGGPLRLTISRNGESRSESLDDMQPVIKNIRNTVMEVTRRTGDTLDLMTSEELRKTLLSLAYHGNMLYQHLHKQFGELIEDIERIQIITFGKTILLIEYVYGGPGFKLNAQVCPNAPQALAENICDQCEHRESQAHICPMKFWGLSKVIERHANSQTSPPQGEELKRIPTPARTPFGAVKPVIFAASDKAFDFTDGDTWKNRLIDSLGRLGAGNPPGIAQDWSGWRDLIVQTSPDPKLLILLAHSDTVLSGIDILEIGDDQLPKNMIEKDLVGADEIPQLLLLLGCATAQVTENFAPYPELFHDKGADIILAPLAPILGADAAPIACRISELLAEWTAKGQEIAFGELLKQIRRDLLAQGHPGVLGLVSFGDADWIFGG